MPVLAFKSRESGCAQMVNGVLSLGYGLSISGLIALLVHLFVMAGLDPAIHLSSCTVDGARTRLSLPLKTYASEPGHDRWGGGQGRENGNSVSVTNFSIIHL